MSHSSPVAQRTIQTRPRLQPYPKNRPSAMQSSQPPPPSRLHCQRPSQRPPSQQPGETTGKLLALQRTLQRIDKHGRHVKAGLIGNLLKTGRAGHIDLGQAVANHVQPHQQQAARCEDRPSVSAISRSRALKGWATPLPPAARLAAHLVALRMRAKAKRHRLAANHQNALVPPGQWRQRTFAPSGLWPGGSASR